MATYQSRAVSEKMPIQSHGLGSSVYTDRFVIDTTAGLTTADVLQFGYLPKYAMVIDATLKSSDIDTNGTPTVALNVGDAGDVDRFFAASTVGQTGTVARMSVPTGFGAYFTDRTLITGAVTANAATGVAGRIELFISFVVMDPGVGYVTT